MGTLTTWRTAVLAILDDSTNARYSSAQVDAAIRQALQRYSVCRPWIRTYSVDGQDTYQIVMPDDFDPDHVIMVEMDDDSDPPTQITFYHYRRDEQSVIETIGRMITSSETVTVTYAMAHTLDGLDSGSGTTVPATDEYACILGAAAFAAISRATSRAEAINLLPEVSANLREQSAAWMEKFEALIKPGPALHFTAPADLKKDEF